MLLQPTPSCCLWHALPKTLRGFLVQHELIPLPQPPWGSQDSPSSSLNPHPPTPPKAGGVLTLDMAKTSDKIPRGTRRTQRTRSSQPNLLGKPCRISFLIPASDHFCMRTERLSVSTSPKRPRAAGSEMTLFFLFKTDFLTYRKVNVLLGWPRKPHWDFPNGHD